LWAQRAPYRGAVSEGIAIEMLELVLCVIYEGSTKKPWQEEIKRMLSIDLKYELDALANQDFRYLTKTCLPRKLKEEDWRTSGFYTARAVARRGDAGRRSPNPDPSARRATRRTPSAG
jgi:hypothetical protein